MKEDNRTSLERSHSKSSNAKLTILCIISTLAVSATWALVILKDKMLDAGSSLIYFGCLAVCAMISIFTLIGFNNFKR